jgi:hypothetical protein
MMTDIANVVVIEKRIGAWCPMYQASVLDHERNKNMAILQAKLKRIVLPDGSTKIEVVGVNDITNDLYPQKYNDREMEVLKKYVSHKRIERTT